MRSITTRILLFSLILLSFFVLASPQKNTQYALYDDTLLYMLKAGEDAEVIAERYHLSVIDVSRFNLAQFEISENTPVEKLLEIGFTFNGKSEIIGPPFKPKPNEDPDYTSEQYALEMMNVFDAWIITEGLPSIKVAIIDTGIDINHSEFYGRISPYSYNAMTEEVGLEAVIDARGHGTAVAGVIAAANDGKGITGIAPYTELLVIKANNDDLGTFSDAVLINSIHYAIEQGVDIINMSLGGSYSNRYIEEAVDLAQSLGIYVVAAAGNNGDDELSYPAAFASTISVSSVDENGNLSSFSSFGDTITVSAPGSNIITTHLDNNYAYFNGTSFAAPQVAGMIALLISYYDSLDYTSLLNLLTSTAMAKDPVEHYGAGIVNAYDALSANLVKVNFETFDGSRLQPIFVQKNQTFEIPEEPVLEGAYFSGWYQDIELNTRWKDEDTTESEITLFAKYVTEEVSLQFFDNETLVGDLTINPGEAFSLPSVTREHYDFVGWFYDLSYTNEYLGEALYEDTNLYVSLTPTNYLVQYYDYDLKTVLKELYYTYLDDFTLIEGLKSDEDPFFEYTFIRWDKSLDLITKDTFIFPEFSKTFKEDSVTLLPGVDTLEQNDTWRDAGVTINSPLFNVVREGDVDETVPGKYLIQYHIYEGETLWHTLSRYVTVLETTPLNFQLNRGLTTLFRGQSYQEAGATSNVGEITILSNVNPDIPGSYRVVYILEYHHQIETLIRYVHVIDFNQPSLWFPTAIKKGGDRDEI